jgi:hypothetical protein
MSAYSEAISRTVQALEGRKRNFRYLAIAVVAIVVVTIAGAGITHSLAALAGVLFLIPTCGFFFLSDTRLVSRWQSDIVGQWANGRLDVVALRDALRAHPRLPRETLDGMLATLPSEGDLLAEQHVPLPTRRAVANLHRSISQGREESLVLTTLSSAVSSIGLVTALWANTWTPLLGMAALTLHSPVSARLSRRRRNSVDREFETLRQGAGFSDTDYVRLVAKFKQ